MSPGNRSCFYDGTDDEGRALPAISMTDGLCVPYEAEEMEQKLKACGGTFGAVEVTEFQIMFFC